MMEVDDLLPDTVYATIDPLIFFTFSPAQSMKSEQIAIFRLNEMLLSIVPVQFAQLYKVGSLCYRRRYSCQISALAATRSLDDLTFPLVS